MAEETAQTPAQPATTLVPIQEATKPIVLVAETDGVYHLALPPGWTSKTVDEEAFQDTPRRKTGSVVLHDTVSFMSYVDTHSITSTAVYCDMNLGENRVSFKAIINDHDASDSGQNWRDFTAFYEPKKSVEWKRWLSKDRTPFGQAEFAMWVEDNLKDIASVEGHPTAAQMMEMALNMEAKQDVRFKSSLRLQSGGVEMSFVQDDDKGTVEKMRLFERFAIGIPVYHNGSPYQLTARLRYRVRDAKVSFWYELIRPDKVLEAAAMEIVETIKDGLSASFWFGTP